MSGFARSTRRRLTPAVRATIVGAGTAMVVVVAAVLAATVVDGDGADQRRVAAVVAGVAVAVAVPWARPRLERMADRMVQGGRPRPDLVLRRFTSRLGPPIPTDELLLQLAEGLKATLRATKAEVWIARAEVLECQVAVPHTGEGARIVLGQRERQVLAKPDVYGPAWAHIWLPALLSGRTDVALRLAPVVNQGETLGVLLVERALDDDFSMAEEAVLAELARHLGLSLRNERLGSALEATLAEVRRANDELRASRARVVETADAERRRIERDLHDGAQQHLLAASVQLRLARGAVPADATAVEARLAQADQSVTDAIDQLGALAHGIYPPLLLDAGLAAALRAAARGHPSPIRVDTDGVGRHPAPVEAAVYFTVVEAMQNAAKHAPGATVSVEVGEDEAGLRFEVTDDGPGFDVASVPRGHGTLNIADRIGAIGGTVRWESKPGAGTRLIGAVPLARDRPDV